MNTKTAWVKVTKSSASFATECNGVLLYPKHRAGKKIRKKLTDEPILSRFLLIHPGYLLLARCELSSSEAWTADFSLWALAQSGQNPFNPRNKEKSGYLPGR